jgi:hypothetical protein
MTWTQLPYARRTPHMKSAEASDSPENAGCFAHANSTQSWRWEKPSFRRGGCVVKTAHVMSSAMKKGGI